MPDAPAVPPSPAPAAASPEPPLPPFFREMVDRFLSRQSNLFLLSGNVGDLIDGLGVSCPATEPDSSGRYVFLDDLLSRRLTSRGRLVVTYDIARGIRIPDEKSADALRQWWCEEDLTGPVDAPAEQQRRGSRFDRAIAESQVYSFLSLRFLEELMKLARRSRRTPVAGGITLIVRHADTLLPDAPIAQMTDTDRQKLTLLTGWFSDPGFVDSIDQVLLVATTASGVSESVRRLPQATLVTLSRPARDERANFINWQHKQAASTAPGDWDALADLSAGMNLLTIQNLLRHAHHRGAAPGEAEVLDALNRLLLSELGDKIEVVRPEQSMADVVGAAALKAELDRQRILLEKRDPSVAPVGILVAGPNGVGKTFIFEAWSAACNRLVIVLKNLRGMYFGETDQTFEKLKGVLEALGNVIIFIDEADTVFAAPGGQTHETEARLFGNVIRMMGDPRNRGRIVWILLTARPENLAPDLKRSGRAGLHLPVFDPEGDDRRAYIDHVLTRAKLDPAAMPAEQRAEFEKHTATLSPADFNELLVELKAERAIAGKLEFPQVIEVIGRLMPGQIARQRRAQTMRAVMECSRRTLLPPSLAALTREDIERELEALGYRG